MTRERRCSKCKVLKDLDKDFGPLKANKEGRRTACRSCINKHAKENYDPKKTSERYYKNHTRRLENIKRAQIKRLYGIKLESYRFLIDNSICRICKSKEDLVLDHNSKTNKLRGVLCRKCNAALGLFQDNSSNLLYAYEYLKGRD